MGACISIHHHKAASAVKVQMPFDSPIKPDHTSVIHPCPTTSTGKLLSVMDDEHVNNVSVKPQLPPSPSPAPATFSEYGSKEETFFDSQAWLDSDYEDEFMSVNGEFTPSRGNTPIHHTLTQENTRVNADATLMDHNGLLGSTSELSPTPTEKRRRLLDLFKESVRDNNYNYDSSFETAEPSHIDGQMGFDKDGLEPKSESHVGFRHGCFKSLLSVRSVGKQKSPTRTLV